MQEKNLKNDVLNSASLAGTILGVFTIACTLLVQIITNAAVDLDPANKFGSGLILVADAVLWLAKFLGCFYIMKHFIVKFGKTHTDFERKHLYRVGMLSALFSATLIGIFTYVQLTYISPELIKQSMDTIYQTTGPLLDSNSLSILENLEANMASYSSLSQLIYCFLYGTILSSILSRLLMPSNPFAGMNKTDSNSTDEQ